MSQPSSPLALFEPASAGKRAILAEALKLFASRGVEAVSVRDIAAAAGVTNPALFRHFAGKDDLARALFEACYRALSEALQAAGTTGGLQAWLEAALRGIEAAPEAVHFVLENLRRYWPALPEPLRARSLPALTREMLQAEQAAGRLRADLDLPLAAAVVLGTLGQFARAAHFRDSRPRPAATAAGLADLLLKGFAPP